MFRMEGGAPDSVPAVLEMPITTPAYLGAMSMWFTENPPRASPAHPRVQLLARTPPATPVAAGIIINDAAVPTKPALPPHPPPSQHAPASRTVWRIVHSVHMFFSAHSRATGLEH